MAAAEMKRTAIGGFDSNFAADRSGRDCISNPSNTPCKSKTGNTANTVELRLRMSGMLKRGVDGTGGIVWRALCVVLVNSSV